MFIREPRLLDDVVPMLLSIESEQQPSQSDPIESLLLPTDQVPPRAESEAEEQSPEDRALRAPAPTVGDLVAPKPAALKPAIEPEPIKGPNGLVLRQGTTSFPKAHPGQIRDRIVGTERVVPEFAMEPVEPDRGGIVVARGTRIVRVESQADDDIYLVPFLEQRLSAGPGAEATQVSEVRLAPIPARIAHPYKPTEILSAEVRGDSMTGVSLYDGDVVYFVRIIEFGEGLHVITINGKVLVKRLQYDPLEETLTIISENTRYSPMVIGKERLEQVRVEGKVIGWVHKHPY